MVVDFLERTSRNPLWFLVSGFVDGEFVCGLWSVAGFNCRLFGVLALV